MRHTAAMTLADVDTGSLNSYSDDIAKRPDLIKLWDRVTIIDKPFNSRMQSEVVVHLKTKEPFINFPTRVSQKVTWINRDETH